MHCVPSKGQKPLTQWNSVGEYMDLHRRDIFSTQDRWCSMSQLLFGYERTYSNLIQYNLCSAGGIVTSIITTHTWQLQSTFIHWSPSTYHHSFCYSITPTFSMNLKLSSFCLSWCFDSDHICFTWHHTRENNCQWKTDITIIRETIMSVMVGIGIGQGEQTSLRKYILHLTNTAMGRGIDYHFLWFIISYIKNVNE